MLFPRDSLNDLFVRHQMWQKATRPAKQPSERSVEAIN